MPCAEQYCAAERQYLLCVALQSIRTGLQEGKPCIPAATQVPPRLQQRGACFVTLHLGDELRGCIGNLQADTGLAEAVARNAYLAAFEDSRFQPVTAQELDKLTLEISVLTPLQALPVGSNQDLLDKLRPGVDGLLLQSGEHRATFLPAVWEQLPDVDDFVARLKRKAGLAADYWADDIQCWIYQAVKIA